MLEQLREVLTTLQTNRLRTILTSVSVVWGIFMLILLLSAGHGLKNAVQHNFEGNATNSIWLRPKKTTLPHELHKPGRRVHFENGDVDALLSSMPAIEHITGRYYRGNMNVSFGENRATFDIRGCHPDHQYLDKSNLLSGRYINARDIAHQRKVAVVGANVVDVLFEGKDPVGETIVVGRSAFRVVGVYEDVGSPGELRKIYLPITTAQVVFKDPNKVHQIMFTVGAASASESEEVSRSARTILARRHGYAPEDDGAVSVQNNLERYLRIMQIFDWVGVFVWVVGAGTVLAGIIGVSNIILISVNERTREIGIRKALGATPASIIQSVVGEALLITSVSGYVGLLAGVGVVELVKVYLPDNDYVRDPGVDVHVALAAVAMLLIAGVIAGLVPSLRAARVSPVVAMREE